MFRTLPKSRTAAAKAARLTPLETALVDMQVTAAFLRPDLYVALVDTATAIINGQVIEIYVIQIDGVALSLAFSMHGVVAILDFWITMDLGEYEGLRL